MLNYGAAVAIKHASSRNPMRKMTPKDLGAFLQNDPEMVMLIANSDCRPAERAKVRHALSAATCVYCQGVRCIQGVWSKREPKILYI